MVLSSFSSAVTLLEMSETPRDKGCSFSHGGLRFAVRCSRPNNLRDISIFKILRALTFAIFQDKVG